MCNKSCILFLILSAVCVIYVAKQKYAHAFNYQGEFPYRMPAILECEFFLLEALVRVIVLGTCY